MVSGLLPTLPWVRFWVRVRVVLGLAPIEGGVGEYVLGNQGWSPQYLPGCSSRTYWVTPVNPFTPKSDQLQISPAASPV